MELSGQTAVVTGAARGIGREIAERLALAGAAIAVVDVAEDAVAQAADELSRPGATARGYRCDVSSLDAAEALGERVLADFGRVDVLVNNAGIAKDRLFVRMTAEDWAAVIGVNLTGAFNVTKAFAPAMLKQRSGSIVNIASVVGQMGNAGQANYAASKAGLIGLTKSLGKELATENVIVNCVTPAAAETDLFKQMTEEHIAYMRSKIPMNRFVQPAEIAALVAWLCSEECGFSTGGVFDISGGRATY